MTRRNDEWHFDPGAAVVFRRDLPFALYLEIEGEHGSISVRVENTIQVNQREGAFVVGPDSPKIPVPMRENGNASFVSLIARKDGSLELRLADATLATGPNPDYESWEIATSADERLVCMPGGEIAVWS